jgi:hypothetical protein
LASEIGESAGASDAAGASEPAGASVDGASDSAGALVVVVESSLQALNSNPATAKPATNLIFLFLISIPLWMNTSPDGNSHCEACHIDPTCSNTTTNYQVYFLQGGFL